MLSSLSKSIWLLAALLFLCLTVRAEDADEADETSDADLLMQDPNLFEGDIELTPEQKVDMILEEAGIPTYAMRIGGKWPYPRSIPYVIDSSLTSSSSAKKAIREAFGELRRLTCLRFRKRRGNEINYIRFVDGNGCYSPVGMNPSSYNRIRLKSGCRSKGVVLHEIMHTLGFWHEQSRPDRDRYVTINYKNIKPKFAYAFKKQTYNRVNSMNSPYDYDSIVHYGRNYFAIDRSKLTIITKKKKYQKKIGQRKRLSKQDVIQLNKRYCK